MKSILPILAGLLIAGFSPLALAQPQRLAAHTGQPPAPAVDPHSGDALIAQVARALEAQPVIAAKLRQRIDLLGRPMNGTGMYLQQGRGAAQLMRLDIQFDKPANRSSLQQICDGTRLWTVEELAGEVRVGYVELARLRGARPKSNPLSPVSVPTLSLGGLPKLITGLRENFQFGGAVAGQLEDPTRSSTGLKIWQVEGTWRPNQLANLAPERRQEIEAGRTDWSQLPPSLPDRVVLFIGADDLFPYRLEYWRTSQDGKAASDPRGKLLAVMELFEVQFNVRLSQGNFLFVPREVEAVDRTKELLDRLGLEDQPASEARRQRQRR